MKLWVPLVAIGLTVATRRPASADAAAASGPTVHKPPSPDYGGQHPAPTTARDVLLWIPRVLLSPLYIVTEYVIRAPLSVLIPAAESAELPRKIRDVFLFGPEHKGGILPVGYVEFGFNPSVGVYGFWNDAFAKDNDWSFHTEAWPSDWYAFSLKERARLDWQRIVQFEFLAIHRPDRVFYGIGSRTLESSQSRFTEALADENVMLEWKYWRESRLQLAVGLHSESLGPGHYGQDPSLEREAATGAFPLPYGFGARYTAEYNRVLVSFDSRKPEPAPGSGLRVEVKAEQGSNMIAPPASGWVRYGAMAAAFLDLDKYQHVVSLSVTTRFADPLGSAGTPFTELVALGGDDLMLGYLPRRLVDRSAAVAAVRYMWPVAPGLAGSIEGALGNVFDAHLEGFRASLLRFSGDLGITTVKVNDYPIEAIVGIGSETFEHGGQIDSARVKLSVNHGF